MFEPFNIPPNVTGVDFYWGTGGDHRAASLCTLDDCIPSGDVPEPGTLALLALSLLAAGTVIRRKPV